MSTYEIGIILVCFWKLALEWLYIIAAKYAICVLWYTAKERKNSNKYKIYDGVTIVHGYYRMIIIVLTKYGHNTSSELMASWDTFTTSNH